MRTRRNNRKLYETIMTRVAREVKRALNEDAIVISKHVDDIFNQNDDFDEPEYGYDDEEYPDKVYTNSPIVRSLKAALGGRNVGIYQVCHFNHYAAPNIDTKDIDETDLISIIIYEYQEYDHYQNCCPCVDGCEPDEYISKNKFMSLCKKCGIAPDVAKYLYSTDSYDTTPCIVFLKEEEVKALLK